MKNKILSIIKNLAFLIAFNIIYFVIWGFENSLSVWLSYGFIHLAYVLLVLSPKFDSVDKMPLLSASTVSITFAYFLMELIAGMVFIILQENYVKVSITVQIGILVLYVILVVVNLTYNNITNDNIAERQTEIAFVKIYSSKLEALKNEVENTDLSKEIEDLYYLLHSSPVKSNLSVKDLESNIAHTIDELSNAIMTENYELAKNLISSIDKKIKERNRLLSLDN